LTAASPSTRLSRDRNSKQDARDNNATNSSPTPPRPARPSAPGPAVTSDGPPSGDNVRRRAITLHSSPPRANATPPVTPKQRQKTPSSKDNTPNRSQSFLSVKLPWASSPNGVLSSKDAALMEKSPTSLARTLAYPNSPSEARSMASQGDLSMSELITNGDEEYDMEMITEVDEDGVDEEMDILLHQVKVHHGQQLTSLRRLLEQSHHSSALQLHALQEETKMLRFQLEGARKAMRDMEMVRATAGPKQVQPDGFTDFYDLSAIIKVNFNERDVERAVRGLPRRERRRL
jgi:hypothetical protein